MLTRLVLFVSLTTISGPLFSQNTEEAQVDFAKYIAFYASYGAADNCADSSQLTLTQRIEMTFLHQYYRNLLKDRNIPISSGLSDDAARELFQIGRDPEWSECQRALIER